MMIVEMAAKNVFNQLRMRLGKMLSIVSMSRENLSSKLEIWTTKPPEFESLSLFSVHRVISLSTIFAPMGSGQFSLRVDKSSTSFGWCYAGTVASVRWQEKLCVIPYDMRVLVALKRLWTNANESDSTHSTRFNK